MKLLLDTHTFIWWDSDSFRLSSHVLKLFLDLENVLMLSVASVWEMQIKLQLGKMKLSIPLAELVESQLRVNKIEILPVKLRHVLALDELPSHHKDPFDRMLISQAVAEGAVLISNDAILSKYPVEVIW
jgi:PIN domain nuclease of toxin-antitoxin system